MDRLSGPPRRGEIKFPLDTGSRCVYIRTPFDPNFQRDNEQELLVSERLEQEFELSLSSEKRRGYDYFDHQADVGIVGFGTSLQEAFGEAAVAMFNLMVDVSRVEPRDEVDIECQGADTEELFVEWLNTLLAQADIHGMVFSQFSVQRINGHRLSGVARGEKLDPDRHRAKLEVKAATYSMLSVQGAGDRWSVRCVVDV